MEVRVEESPKKKTVSNWKIDLNPDILFLILDRSVYLLILDWKEKLNHKYTTICNLEIKTMKNILKSINYYSPRLVIIVGKSELETNKILVKDCQKKQEFRVDKKELVNWIYDYL